MLPVHAGSDCSGLCLPRPLLRSQVSPSFFVLTVLLEAPESPRPAERSPVLESRTTVWLCTRTRCTASMWHGLEGVFLHPPTREARPLMPRSTASVKSIVHYLPSSCSFDFAHLIRDKQIGNNFLLKYTRKRFFFKKQTVHVIINPYYTRQF